MIMDTLFEECMCGDEQALQSKLFESCMSGDEQALHALIQLDPLILDRTVASCEETPLHVAVLRGHISIAKALLVLKPKLASEADATGRVPLHLASAQGSAEAVRELLRANADLCAARDHCGRTPLHLGVVKGRLDVVRELIRVCPGSASERSLDRGETVFHLAIKHCRLEVLKLLVEVLKDDRRQLLVATDDEGNTVLHFAVIYKQIQTVRYLVSLPEVKEIANATNHNGHTTLDVMEKSLRHFNSFEVVKTLTQFGARRGKHDEPKHPNNPTIALPSPPPPRTTNVAQTDNSTKYQKPRAHWITDALGNLMMVATVIASIAFHAGIHPPGGSWQQGGLDRDAEVLYYFYSRNAWGLMGAVSVILLHFRGFPLKSRVGTWLMTLATCLMLHNMILAYFYSTYRTLEDVSEAWTLIMLMIIVIVHTTCISCWLIFDKVTSFLSSRSVLCGRKLMRTVGFVAGSFVVAYVMAISVDF